MVASSKVLRQQLDDKTPPVRSRLRRDLRAFCLAVLPRSRPDLIGKGRRIEAVIGLAAEGRKGDAMLESAVKWVFKGEKHGGRAFAKRVTDRQKARHATWSRLRLPWNAHHGTRHHRKGSDAWQTRLYTWS